MTATSVLRRLKDVPRQVWTEEGQALVEYSLLLSLIVFAALFAVQAFGLGVSGMFSTIVANYP
jgi:Flp pilus assembly pilin Flp